MQLFFHALVSGVFTGILFAGIAMVLALSNLADRSLHVASGTIIALLAYVWIWIVKSEPGFWVSALALLVVAFAGNFACLAVYRWLERCRVSSEGIVVASFGLLITGNAALELIWGTAAMSLRAPWLRGWVNVGGPRISYADLFMAVSLVVLIGVQWLALRRGGLSLKLRAVFEDAREAAVAGVNVRDVQILAYGFSAVMLIVISLSIGGRSSVTPHMGFFPLLIGIAALVTGGLGSLRGAFWTGLGMGILWDIVGVFFGTIWQFASVFGVLAVVLLTVPEGLSSLVSQLRHRPVVARVRAPAGMREVR